MANTTDNSTISNTAIKKADAEIIASYLESLLENNLKSTDHEKLRTGFELLLTVLKEPLEYQDDYNKILFDCIKCFIDDSNEEEKTRKLLEHASLSKAFTIEQHQQIVKHMSIRGFSPVDKSSDQQHENNHETKEMNRNAHVHGRGRNRGNYTRGNQGNGKSAQGRDGTAFSGQDYLSNIPRSVSSEQQQRFRGNSRDSSNNRFNGRYSSGEYHNTNVQKRHGQNADLSQYQCFTCNEYGHVTRGCPRQSIGGNRGNRYRAARGYFQPNNRGSHTSTLNPVTSDDDEASASFRDDETTSSTTSTDEILSDKSGKRKQLKKNKPECPSVSNTNNNDNASIEKIHSLTMKFVMGKEIDNENENANLSTLVECIGNMDNKQQQNQNQQKESLYFNMLVHIAQNNNVYNDELCTQLFHHIYDRHLLIKQKCYRKLIKNFIVNDRQNFCHQRPLIYLNDINKHVHDSTETKRTMLNDLQEYLLRSNGTISELLYVTLKQFIVSGLKSDNLLYNRICHLIFNEKKNLFSEQQINELAECVHIREKRVERNIQRTNWRKRLASMKNQHVEEDIDQLLNDLEQVLNAIESEHLAHEKDEEESQYILNHYQWYNSILLLASCGHLNSEQYKRLLTIGIKSSIFNVIQKLYMHHYLNEGRAPVTLQQVNDMELKLQSEQQTYANDDYNHKQQVFDQIKQILSIQKPLFFDKQTTIKETSIQEQNNVESLTQFKLEELPNDDVKQEEQNRSANQTTSGTHEFENKIPFIDNYITSRLMSLIELICSDSRMFSSEQCKELLDSALKTSALLKPIARKDKEKLQLFYLRPMSVNELQSICAKLSDTTTNICDEDLFNEFKILMEKRPFTTNSKNLLMSTINHIYHNKTKYSSEQCKELKNIIEHKPFGKKCHKKLLRTFQLTRAVEKVASPQQTASAPPKMQQQQQQQTITQNNTNVLSLNPIILNKLFSNIIKRDNNAYQEFLNIIEQLPNIMTTTSQNLIIEANYCIITHILLYIKQNNSNNSLDYEPFDETKLNKILEDHRSYFSTFLSEEEQQDIFLNLTKTTSNIIDNLIKNVKQGKNDIKTLLSSIENIRTKNDLQEVISFIIYTFENDNLQQYVENDVVELIQLIQQHSLCNQSDSHILEYLNDLLEKYHLHLSPKQVMKQLEGIANNQQCDEILINIQHMLELATSKYAIDEWKQIMIKVLKHCFKNENILLINNKQLNDLKETVKSSPMFSKKLWKTQMLPCYDTCGEDGQQEEKLPTKGSPLNGDTNTYADLFSKLESSDPLLNENVLTDLRTILENEQLPSTISMKKYISALKYVFKNVEKFSLNSNIDKWLNLVRKNRKKLFVDQQCDQLLMTLIFLKLNLTDHSLTTINYLIKSRKRSECVEGLRLLGKILDYNDSQYVCKTMGDELFKMIVNVAYNERFNTDDVKKALKYGQNCQHLSDTQREKLKLLL